MKANFVFSGAGILTRLRCAVFAQARPATPAKFNTKPVGAAISTAGASINPPGTITSIRQVTYLTLSPLRQWNSIDGKSRLGKLIAWQETVTTTSGMATPVPQSALTTTKPTALKNHKVRLLIASKVSEVFLDRLAAEEPKFIQDLQTALAGKH